MKNLLLTIGMACVSSLTFAQTSDDIWVSSEVDVSGFDRIRAVRGLDVDIVVGEEYGMTIETLNMPNDAIFWKQRGNTLTVGIKWKNLLAYAKEAEHVDTEVTITAPTLTYLQLKHAGESTLSGNLEAEKLKLKVGGAADLVVESIEVEKLIAQVHGAGTLTVAGTAQEQKIRMRGVATYYASDLATSYTDVKARGASEAKVQAIDWLKATARGASDIEYVIEPKVQDTLTRGPSDITRKSD